MNFSLLILTHRYYPLYSLCSDVSRYAYFAHRYASLRTDMPSLRTDMPSLFTDMPSLRTDMLRLRKYMPSLPYIFLHTEQGAETGICPG